MSDVKNHSAAASYHEFYLMNFEVKRLKRTGDLITLESIAPENSQDRSAWGGPSLSKQNFAWTLNALI